MRHYQGFPLTPLMIRGPVFEQPNEGSPGGQAPQQNQQPQQAPFRDPYIEEQKRQEQWAAEGEEGFGDDEVNDLISSFSTEEPDSDSEPNGGTDGPDPQQANNAAKAMGQEIQKMISDFKLPDDTFDEDFAQGDPQAVRRAIENASRAAIQQSLEVAMKPTRLVIEQMQEHLTSMMDQKIKDSSKQSREQDTLTSKVPALGDESSAKVLKPINDTLMAQGKSLEERARALNVIAKRLSLPTGEAQKQNRQPQSSGNDNVRTGAAALDALFKN